MSFDRQKRMSVIRGYAENTRINLGIFLEMVNDFEKRQGDAIYIVWNTFLQHGFTPDDVRRFREALNDFHEISNPTNPYHYDNHKRSNRGSFISRIRQMLQRSKDRDEPEG